MFKKRSHFKLLSLLGISLLTSIGVLTGISFGNKAVEKAEAVNECPATIYCKMEYSWWTENSAAIAAYCYTGDDKNASWPGVRMTFVSGNVWKYDLPKDYSNVIFVRVNGGTGAVSDWGAQTKDLTIPKDGNAGNDFFTITTSTATWSGGGGKCDGTWSKYYDDGWYVTGSNPDMVKMTSIDNGQQATITTTSSWSGILVTAYSNGVRTDHYANDVNNDTGHGASENADFNKGGDWKAYVQKPNTYILKAYYITDTNNMSYRFSLSQYTISYKKGTHGTGSDASDTKDQGFDITLKDKIFTRLGYIQSGWSTNSSGTTCDYALKGAFSENNNKTLYPYWEEVSQDVTITFNFAGGTSEKVNITARYDQPMPVLQSGELPIKTNCVFLGYFTASSGGTQYYNADGTSAKNSDFTEPTTLYAHWQINSGTYLAGDFTGTYGEAGWTRDGKYNLIKNPDKLDGNEYVVKGLTFENNAECKIYFVDSSGNVKWYGESGGEETVNVSWSHPYFKGTILSGLNCQINIDSKAGVSSQTFDIYFESSSTKHEYHLAVPSMPSNGFYFMVNGQDAKSDLHKGTEWDGLSEHKEYKATFQMSKGDKLKIYFQNSSEISKYAPRLRVGSARTNWIYNETEGLICNETGTVTYTFYLCSNDGQYWNEVSIFLGYEDEANNFANEFNKLIACECQRKVDGDSHVLSGIWESLGDSEAEVPAGKTVNFHWDLLSNEAQGILTNATAVDATYGEFAAKYDYVYMMNATAYSLTDFAGRNPVKLQQNINKGWKISESEDQTVLIVVIASASLLTLSAAALTLLLKKKKHTKD